jgi:hypothetical protein
MLVADRPREATIANPTNRNCGAGKDEASLNGNCSCWSLPGSRYPQRLLPLSTMKLSEIADFMENSFGIHRHLSVLEMRMEERKQATEGLVSRPYAGSER